MRPEQITCRSCSYVCMRSFFSKVCCGLSIWLRPNTLSHMKPCNEVELSCKLYSYRFTFPSVFIVYGTLTVGVFELFVLIGYMDRKLFCNSRDLIESLDNPTVFCSIQGNAACNRYMLVCEASVDSRTYTIRHVL